MSFACWSTAVILSWILLQCRCSILDLLGLVICLYPHEKDSCARSRSRHRICHSNLVCIYGYEFSLIPSSWCTSNPVIGLAHYILVISYWSTKINKLSSSPYHETSIWCSILHAVCYDSVWWVLGIATLGICTAPDQFFCGEIVHSSLRNHMSGNVFNSQFFSLFIEIY